MAMLGLIEQACVVPMEVAGRHAGNVYILFKIANIMLQVSRYRL